MSADPGDDDDIEEKLDRLISEISQLTDVLRSAMSGEPMEEEEGAGEPVDLWDEGRTSQQVSDATEYQRVRSVAATSENIAAPWLSNENFETRDQKLGEYVSLFQSGVVNLEEMNAGLSNDNFSRFLQLHVVQDSTVGGEPAIEPQLMEIADPTAALLGVTFSGDEVFIDVLKSPASYVKAYGFTWHSEANPSAQLGLAPTSDIKQIIGRKQPKELNEDLANIIFETRNRELPEGFINLLTDENRAEYLTGE